MHQKSNSGPARHQVGHSARYFSLGTATLAVVAVGSCLLGGLAVSQDQPQPRTPQQNELLPRHMDNPPAAASAAAPARLPVPDAAKLQTVQAKIRELYGAPQEAAKKPAEKIALANTVWKTANESSDDATARYALLVLARNLAIEGGDVQLALRTTDALTDDFELDSIQEPYAILAKWVENPDPNAPAMVDVANALQQRTKDLAEDEDYPNAVKHARLALEAAKKARSVSMIKEITALGIDLTARQTEHAALPDAERKLAADPHDPTANMMLGRWHWFRKNDPMAAMPYLAKTVDSPLKKAAAAELENPKLPSAQVALADQWWTLAQSVKDEPTKNALLVRAADWYAAALPELTSLDKIKAERRIAELKPLVAKSKPGSSGPAAVAPGAVLSPQERLKLVQAEGETKESEVAVERGLKWLASMQARDGGWNFDTRSVNAATTDAGTAANARNGATGMALLPFLAAGYTHKSQNAYQKTIKNGLAFLAQNQNPKYSNAQANSVAWHEDEGTMYSHGLAAAAMCDAYAKTKDRALLPLAQGSLNFIALAQDPSGGGWRYVPRQPGDTSVFGWQFMALKSGSLGNLRVNPVTLKLTSKFLDSVSDAKDERPYYGYTVPGKGPAQTAIGLHCRIHSGWTKNNSGLKTGVEYLTKLGPSKSNNYFNYHANNVLYQWGGDEWKTWNTTLRDQLVKGQTLQGTDAGSWNPALRDIHSQKGGRLYNTALSCLMLEVSYRYPRVLGK